MAKEIYRRPVGTGLTPEEFSMLEEAEKYSPVYDEEALNLPRNNCLNLSRFIIKQWKIGSVQ